MRSNYKVLTSVDLSNNNLYNVSEIIGNDYDTVSTDLSIHPRDKDDTSHLSTLGNLVLRAGADSDTDNTGGYVHIYAGLIDNIIDESADSGYGIKLFPERIINIIDDVINIRSNDSTDGFIELRVNSDVSYDDSSDTYLTMNIDSMDIGSETITTTSNTSYIKIEELIQARAKYWQIVSTKDNESIDWDDSDELESRDFYLKVTEESTVDNPNVLAVRNLKINGAVNARGFGIYWDEATNSLIFTEGNIAWQ